MIIRIFVSLQLTSINGYYAIFLWLSSVSHEKYRNRALNQDTKTPCHVTPGRDGVTMMAAGLYSGYTWFEYR
jgi:hypothetical protein